MERSERASVSVSSSPQKNSLLNFFGCCSPSKNGSEDLKPTKRTTIPAHPATTISMGQTSAKKSFATEVDHYNSQPGNLAKQIYNEGNSEVSILKDFRGVGRVMLLGDKYKIIAKINIINVEKVESWQQMMTTVIKEPKRSGGSFDSPNAKKKETIKGSIINTMKRTFSKAEDNDYAHQPQITSQSIAAHVAKRLKCDIIIDALCGFGGNTIQFANTCNYVIAIDSNPERIACAKVNAQKILPTLDTIDFMAMDFLKIKKLSGDIVFLHPTDSRKNQMDHFSLYKNLEPELPELLTKSLEISHCVAIKLPHETDMSELASVFHSCFEKNRLHKKRFCIEVERICDSDGKPECLMVYFGDLSTIDPKEEYEALYDYMLSEESNETRARIPLQVFAAIIEKVGLGKSFKYLAEIDNKTNITRFNDFTALIIEKEIITQEDLEKLIDEESKRPSSSIFSAPNSYTPTLALLKKTSSALNDTVRSALLNGQMKKKTNESRGNNNNNNIWGSNSEEESESVPGRSNKILGSKFRNLRDNSTPPSSMLPKERFDTEENNHEHFKNSHEVSDLIISSYSVDSNYLDDFSPYDETDINIRKNSRAKKEHPEIATRNRQSSMKMSRIRSKEDLTRSRKSSRHQKDTGYHFASNLTHREEHTQSDRDHDTVPFSKFKDEPNQSQRDEEDAEENQIKMGTINKYI